MRAVTITIGKFHIVLAAGVASQIQLTAAKPKPRPAEDPSPIRVRGNQWERDTDKPAVGDRPRPAPSK